MKPFIKVVLTLCNALSTMIIVLFIIIEIYKEIMGVPKTDKLLENLHVPLNYRQILVLALICTVVMIITEVLKIKIFKK